MSTRSTISICKKTLEGIEYKGIYCHWDGYLSYNGFMLLNYFNDGKKVEELISLGDLSSLHKNIYPKEGKKHTFDEPQEDVCVFYNRDRGEDWKYTKPYVSSDEEDFFEKVTQEYDYLFKDGKWLYRCYGSDWEELTMKDCVEKY